MKHIWGQAQRIGSDDIPRCKLPAVDLTACCCWILCKGVASTIVMHLQVMHLQVAAHRVNNKRGGQSVAFILPPG